MSQEWVEVVIETSADAGELLGILGDPYVSGAWHDHGTTRVYWPATHWHPGVVPRIEAIIKTLPHSGGRHPETPSVAVRQLPAENWNAHWARSIQPLRIGRRVVVRPSWSNVEVGQHEIELVIDPKQAFGTGHHATTQLLIEWLEEKIRGGERILDLGTGSGILAMAALRLGAGCAVGLDIDPIAIDCARDYAKANGFGPELQFQVAAVHVPRSERFDLVVASLDRRTILESVPALTLWVTSGAILLLSGLLREDRNDVAVAFAQFGVAIRSFRERDGWLGIEMMQTEHCEGT